MDARKCKCGGNVVVAKGSETSRQPECDQCGAYLYFYGSIRCCTHDDGLEHITRRRYDKLMAEATEVA